MTEGVLGSGSGRSGILATSCNLNGIGLVSSSTGNSETRPATKPTCAVVSYTCSLLPLITEATDGHAGRFCLS